MVEISVRRGQLVVSMMCPDGVAIVLNRDLRAIARP